MRYVAVPSSGKPLYVETPLWDDQKAPLCPNLAVDGTKSVDTGLVDSSGNAIHRVQPPIGFGRDREW
jgi:hypothetical protein